MFHLQTREYDRSPMHELYLQKVPLEILRRQAADTMFSRYRRWQRRDHRQIPADNHYTIMKKSRYICAATKSGVIDMLDTPLLKVVRSCRPTWPINDMDAQNDFIVTCGGSPSNRSAQTYTC